MAKCSRCAGSGSETYDEDNRMVTDVCYHCSGTGEVEPEVDLHDRLMRVAYALALQAETEYRDACNNDPDGDGYDLGAAENMLSVHDYFRSRVEDRQYKFGDQLRNVDSAIQKILLDWHEKPKCESEIPTVRFPPSPNGSIAIVEQERVLAATRTLTSPQFFGDDAAWDFLGKKKTKKNDDDDIPF